MICPRCDRETSGASTRCGLCGAPLDVTFDDVRDEAVVLSEQEARSRPEELATMLLAAAVVFLVLMLLANALLVPSPPSHLVEPTYQLQVGVERPSPALPIELPPLELPR